MIHYALKCSDGHEFESWFQSGSAFDALRQSGHVTCPTCGSSKVEKSLMAPSVRPARKDSAQNVEKPGLTAPSNDREAALAELRRHVEENSEYVGMNFSAEARRIHDGDAPERAIYGEARLEDARSLIEDGVPVAPLPFIPQRKSN
jgi:hypothetical protein